MNRPCVAIAPYEDGARYSRVRLWLLLACILCQPVFHAQSAVTEELTDRSGDHRYPPRSVQFTQITRSDGLSQSAIHAIMQDNNGYMWLGTQEGLNRYDGYEMVVYENDVTDRDSLSHDWIWSLFSDQQGNVWVGTNGGGLNRFDARQNRFTRFRHDAGNSNSICSDKVRVITQDRSGSFWIGTDGAGLCRYDAETQLFQHYRFDPSDPHSIPGDTVRDILEDRRSILWIATDGGLARLDAGVFTRYRHDATVPTSLSGDHVRTITEHTDGRLWIGTHDRGLNLFDPEGGKSIRFRHDSADHHSLSGDLVRDVLVDQGGTVWVATDSGLSEWRPDQGGFVRYTHSPTDATSLGDNRINKLYQDAGGVLWVGTYNGINRWNYASDAFSVYQKDSGYLSHDVVNAISESESGALWIGTYGGGLNRLDPDATMTHVYRHDPLDPGSLRDDRVMTVQVDHNDDVWVGTRTGGLSRLNQASGKFEHYMHDPGDPDSLSADGITSILCDPDGTVWLGTYGGGLNRFEPSTSTFRAYRHSADDPASISSDRVLAVYRGKSGDLWVGTEDGGLNRFDESRHRFERFLHDPDDPASISSNTAWELHESRDGSLWIGTLAGGLNRWHYQDRLAGKAVFTKYRKSNGLNGDTVFGVLEDLKGYIWLSGNRGLTRLDPQSGKVRNFDRSNGVLAEEFNFGARLGSRNGRLLFGGMGGLISFNPDRVQVNMHEPPIVVTAQSTLQSPMTIHSAALPATMQLDHTDYYISFEFSALDYASPDDNQYLYILEGFDVDWIDPGQYRKATYTKLPPGRYTFRVKAANNDGIWNPHDASVELRVVPPPWLSPWAYALYILMIVGAIAGYVVWQNRKLASEALQRRMLEHKVKLRTKELEERNSQLQELNARVTEISMQDSLTGLLNRRYLHETIESQIANVDRQFTEIISDGNYPTLSDSLFFMMIDLDGFKHINDSFGHHTGDQVLLQVSEILKASTRSGDTIIRWGGDEFLIFGRGRNQVGVEHLAERVRTNILEHRYVLGAGNSASLSVSIGFAPYPFSIHQPLLFSWEQVSSIADQATYMAKRSGRNAWVGITGNANTEPEDLRLIMESNSIPSNEDGMVINMFCGGLDN